jgi:hypothetical protein
MGPDHIDHRSLLADEQMARAMKYHATLLLGRLGRDKPHVRPSAGLHEALLPAPDHRFALAGLPHDLGGAQTVCGEQDDPGASNMLLRAVPVGNDRCKTLATASRNVHHDSFAHPPDSHARESRESLKGLVC